MALSLSAGHFPWPRGNWNFNRRRPSRQPARSSTVAGAGNSGGRFRATPGGGGPQPARGPALAMGPNSAIALGVVGGVLGLSFMVAAAVAAYVAAITMAVGACVTAVGTVIGASVATVGVVVGAAVVAAGSAMAAAVMVPVTAVGSCFQGIAEGFMYLMFLFTSSAAATAAGGGFYFAGEWLVQELLRAREPRRRPLRRKWQRQQQQQQPQEQQGLQADLQQEQQQRPGDECAGEKPREEELRGEGAAGSKGRGAGAAVRAAAAAWKGPVVLEGVPDALEPLGRVGTWVASWEPDNVRAALPVVSVGFGVLAMRAALSVMVHSSRAHRYA